MLRLNMDKSIKNIEKFIYKFYLSKFTGGRQYEEQKTR